MQKIVPKDAVLIPDNAAKVFGGVIYDVYQWPQTEFDGSVKTYEMLKRADSVWVICIDGDSIVLTRDEQPHRGVKTTLPGGKVDPGDSSLLAAAQRELREETGLSCSDWRLVDCVQPNTKVEWFFYTYLAQGTVTQQAPQHEAGERIATIRVGYTDLLTMAAQKTGDVQFVAHLLAKAKTIEELRQLPDFTGTVLSAPNQMLAL